MTMRMVLALAVTMALVYAPAERVEAEPTQTLTSAAYSAWAFSDAHVAKVLNDMHKPRRDKDGMALTTLKYRYVLRDVSLEIFYFEGGSATDVVLEPISVEAALQKAKTLKKAFHASSEDYGSAGTVSFSRPSERRKDFITFSSQEEGAWESCTLFLNAAGLCYKIRYMQGC